ncbi:hypothetical protein [Klebsiella quasipneumoniae]|uniref:hypothetical protein n=1 Tax=Klebsiella quasipneumoniae TaxID=1463165 RepID=UPI0023E1B62E|nr:hypothetical protein [Klebsiella quasipneumoniae]
MLTHQIIQSEVEEWEERMLTHQIIQSEVEELKQLLTERDLTIPSFWSCVWPGRLCTLWFLLSSYFSYGISDFSTSMDKLANMVFAGAMGVFSTIAIANTRSLFLKKSKHFRITILVFKCISKKSKPSIGCILVMFSLFAFTTSSIGWNVVGFCVLTMFSIVITVMVMNIDLGRYQLATHLSSCSWVRNKGVKLQ